ncbi:MULTISPECIES: ABC transporter ATP-binding protein [unclassified Bradyrhizobium]|uniref:energy-coupling factor ABC transporter ATP-binding protein n=1 Tax=unclassified Bradyrhizobium TaxID=2631580 RepID=UPI0024797D4F|nr:MULTISPECIES: ABC transporter ATP-binding protein [unclassified Bradyrhizobium]WGS18120.1 energy-coupling factor ABC transporter ATP-binding protein [Bradyrhizobium sp. ISRA463]WGS24933.1 energy-coupling factor ABC transporter ATP-binding protein [Bradyrhizobium sp. ISRA464]
MSPSARCLPFSNTHRSGKPAQIPRICHSFGRVEFSARTGYWWLVAGFLSCDAGFENGRKHMGLLDILRSKRSPGGVQPGNGAEPCRAAPSVGAVFDQVSLGRGGNRIFDGLSLDLRERRIGLVGDNGSGKSTLLRLANGLLSPQRGEVVVNGRRTTQAGRELHLDVGFVFQNPDHQIIFPTVGEEVAFGLIESGQTAAQARQAASDLLADHGCAGWIDRAIHDLSEGQKQLVCILAILATEPRILLLDEPFSSLDLPTRLSLSARLARLPQQIVMASHDLDLLRDFDRVIWLEKGQVRADGTPSQVLPDYRAHAAARGALMLESGAA